MDDTTQKAAAELIRLMEIMERLRGPDGCSWDRKQNHQSLAKFISEEAQEVVEAIEGQDVLDMVEELGDLLMLIVFNAQIGKENGTFTIEDVGRGICNKLELRHPHVFGNKDNKISPDEVIELWGEVKKVEKADKKKISNRMKEALRFPSAIKIAERVQQEAATVGFDFPNKKEAFKKIHEETREVEAHLTDEKSESAQKLKEEIGDLLFSIINVTRLSGIDTEDCLKQASEKFVQRFSRVETLVDKDGGFNGKSLQELDTYWDKIK
jgi:tetrapyrrole methylase family protein/MazG family protein